MMKDFLIMCKQLKNRKEYKMKRKLGDIWKDESLPKNSRYGGQWKIQFPYGVYSCYSKKDAKEWQRIIYELEHIKTMK